MRDQTIVESFSQVKAAMTGDVVNLTEQLILIRARVDAVEKVLFGSRFGMVRTAFLCLFSPKAMAKVMQIEHQTIFNGYRKAIGKAQEWQKIIKAPNMGVIHG